MSVSVLVSVSVSVSVAVLVSGSVLVSDVNVNAGVQSLSLCMQQHLGGAYRPPC